MMTGQRRACLSQIAVRSCPAAAVTVNTSEVFPQNKIIYFVGCFDPINVCFYNKINIFRGDLSDILADTQHW